MLQDGTHADRRRYPRLVPDILIATDSAASTTRSGPWSPAPEPRSDGSAGADGAGRDEPSSPPTWPSSTGRSAPWAASPWPSTCAWRPTPAGSSPGPVLLVLDRRPDVFMARRSGADGWILKPLDPIRLRKAVAALLAGGTWHDTSFTPDPVVVPAR